MKKLLAIIFVSALFVAPSSLLGQDAGKTEVEKIVKKMDELYRSTTSVSTIEMDIITPHWERPLKMKAWSMGLDKFFIRILSPKKERGLATLRVGNEMWNYLPKTNKVMKVAPSMMMSSWMGSDFTNDDLVKEFTFFESYNFEMTTIDNPEEGLLYVKCIPKEDLPIIWGYIIIAVQEKDYFPVWQKFYDEKEKCMRVIYYKDIKRFDNRKIPSVMELIPLNKEGHKTVIRYIDAQFDVKLDKNVFTLRNLRKRI